MKIFRLSLFIATCLLGVQTLSASSEVGVTYNDGTVTFDFEEFKSWGNETIGFPTSNATKTVYVNGIECKFKDCYWDGFEIRIPSAGSFSINLYDLGATEFRIKTYSAIQEGVKFSLNDSTVTLYSSDKVSGNYSTFGWHSVSRYENGNEKNRELIFSSPSTDNLCIVGLEFKVLDFKFNGQQDFNNIGAELDYPTGGVVTLTSNDGEISYLLANLDGSYITTGFTIVNNGESITIPEGGAILEYRLSKAQQNVESKSSDSSSSTDFVYLWKKVTFKAKPSSGDGSGDGEDNGDVTESINVVDDFKSTGTEWFDLQGRPVKERIKGHIYISREGKAVRY